MSIKYSVLSVGLAGLRGLYSIMKLRKTKNRITIISRQSDTPSLDIKMLQEYLDIHHPEIQCKVMAKFIKSGIAGKLSYAFHILKQMSTIATSRVVMIDGYCIAVSVLKHKPETKIIQMWHAMAAIKKFGYQTRDKEAGHSSRLAEIMCMHKNYDYILCPSEETGKIFCEGFNSSSDKLKLLALPRIDYLLNDKDDENERRREMLKAKAGEKKIILYVPTFRTSGEVSLKELCEALDFEKYYLVVSPHPFDIINCEKTVRDLNSDSILIDNTVGSFSWLKVCDMIISDYSAIGVESLVTEKPIYYYLYDIDKYEEEVGLNVDLLKEMPSCSSKDASELAQMIASEYNYSEFENFKNKYISADTKDCTGKLAEFAAGLCR